MFRAVSMSDILIVSMNEPTILISRSQHSGQYPWLAELKIPSQTSRAPPSLIEARLPFEGAL